MGSYRNEDEALIGLARQLTDAYGEARRREDQDFACDAIAEFLAEYRTSAPSEALLAILDLPLTAETYPLVDEAQTTLADRGPAAVELLLEAVLGEVYDPDGPAPDRAAEALDMMDRRDTVQGLVEVLCGRAGDDVKGAAVDGLVALGSFAEPALVKELHDPDGGEWARAALEQIRLEAAHPEALEEYAAGEGEVPDDASTLLEPDEADEAEDADAYDGDLDEDDEDEGEDVVEDAAAGDGQAGGEAPEPGQTAPAGAPAESAGPDQQLVDDAYDEFLNRFGREAEEGPSPS